MSDAPVLFIDANQYINFYRLVAGRKLIDSLEEQKDYIFLTSQIRDEVNRNKLNVASTFLAEQFKRVKLPKVNVPDHLFGFGDEKTKELRKTLEDLREQAEKARADLTQLATDTLFQIGRSQDEVSRRLQVLFDNAKQPSAEELNRARERKERGNPPGDKGEESILAGVRIFAEKRKRPPRYCC
jgi:hypothetical protein